LAYVKSKRAVLEVLFPAVRAKLLRLLVATPGRQYYGRELTIRSGLALHTVQDELRKLTALGLLTSSSNGYHRFYRADRNHPLYPHLLGIIQLSDKLPTTKHSALRRPASGRASTRKTKRNPRHLSPQQPLNWHLFTKQ
jgi:predicted transcriptional regulator